jgi:N-acylglucosamine 2-epimerase
MKYLEMFENQYNFCMKYFYDPKYGEWYERLYRDGSVKVADKGTRWKCAYHLVRSLVQIIAAFERVK